LIDPDAHAVAQSASIGVDPEVNRLYLAHYSAREIRISSFLDSPTDRILTEYNLSSFNLSAFKRSDIYNELLLPYDIPHIMGVWLCKQDRFQAVVIEGGKKRGAFQAPELQRLAQLVPHLARVAKMRELTASLRQASHAYRQTLERLPYGVVLLDNCGRIFEATPAAEAVLRRAHGLLQILDRLKIDDRDQDQRLQKAILDIIRSKSDRATASTQFTISRKAGPPLILHLIDIRTQNHLLGATSIAVLVLIVDVGFGTNAQLASVQLALSATKAESKLAHAILSGASLKTAANTLGITENTAKSQLKSIYRKNDLRNHADLVRKLMLATLVRS
jgi:DNA-binding CsgD family transcriptional regulator/PAS domain-containing protein